MAFEQQEIKVRNLCLSDKSEIAYGQAAFLDATFNIRPRFAGDSFVNVAKEFYDDADRAGKGHMWATLHKEISRMTSFDSALDIDELWAGWICAFLFGNDTITGAGPYTHTFKFLQSTTQMPVTNVYTEDTADVKTKWLDMAINNASFSGTDRGPLQCRFSMIGSGRFTDGADGALPAVPTPTKILGSDTDVLLGPQGGAVSIKERIRSWQIDVSNNLNPHRATGGGLYATMTKLGLQRVKVTLAVSAKDVDDIRTLFLNDTLRELQINTNSGAAAQLNFKFPGLYFSAAQLGVSGIEEIWQLESNEVSVIKSGANEVIVPVVINNQATAYLIGA
jgi:hypothetical protein